MKIGKSKSTEFGMVRQYRFGARAALDDFSAGYKMPAAWFMMAQQKVNLQYKRTILGPWWITVQRIIFVASLSTIFGGLLEKNAEEFVPYVAVGFVFFQLLVGGLNGGAGLLVSNSSFIKTSPLPFSVLHYRQLAGTLIQFFHDCVALAILLIVIGVHLGSNSALALVGLLLIFINTFAFGLWLGPLGARFRDLSPLISALSSVLMYLTPIFWKTSDFAQNQRLYVSVWNPLSYLLEVARNPLLGEPVTWFAWKFALFFTFANTIIGFLAFTYTRRKIYYWV